MKFRIVQEKGEYLVQKGNLITLPDGMPAVVYPFKQLTPPWTISIVMSDWFSSVDEARQKWIKDLGDRHNRELKQLMGIV